MVTQKIFRRSWCLTKIFQGTEKCDNTLIYGQLRLGPGIQAFKVTHFFKTFFNNLKQLTFLKLKVA